MQSEYKVISLMTLYLASALLLFGYTIYTSAKMTLCSFMIEVEIRTPYLTQKRKSKRGFL